MVDELEPPPDYNEYENPLAAYLSTCLDEWFKFYPQMTVQETCIALDELRSICVEEVLRSNRRDLF